LWDIPDDPRAALRWSLTKLRPLVGERLQADRDSVMLDVDGLDIDVLALRRAVAAGPETLPAAELTALARRVRGPALEDCDLSGAPGFEAFVTALRHEMERHERAIIAALLQHPLDAPARLAWLDRLLVLDPDDAAAVAARRGVLEQGAAGGAAALAAAPALPRGALASVAVLPFQAAGDAVLASVLGDLVTTGVADQLSRFSSLSIVAAPPGPADAVAAGRALGVGYAIAGSVLVAAGQVRVRYRLIETATGTQIAAGDMARTADDLLTLDREMAGAIAAVIEPKVRFSAAWAASAQPRADASPRELFLMALAEMVQGGDFGRVARLLEQALAIDPHFALAGAFRPWAALQIGEVSSEASRQHFAAIARQAAHDAPGDVIVQAIAALMIVLLEHDFDVGVAMIDRAARLNPDSVFVWVARGWCAIHAGDLQAPYGYFDRAEALSLEDPTDNNINAGRAIAAFQAGDLAAAGRYARLSLALMQTSLEGYRAAIAVAVELGDLAEARRLAAALIQRAPGERARRALLLPFRRRETSDRLYRAFLAAGIPD
jgi:TolB-like protein/Tfp pilus assembly protein PilF